MISQKEDMALSPSINVDEHSGANNSSTIFVYELSMFKDITEFAPTK